MPAKLSPLHVAVDEGLRVVALVVDEAGRGRRVGVGDGQEAGEGGARVAQVRLHQELAAPVGEVAPRQVDQRDERAPAVRVLRPRHVGRCALLPARI